MLLLIIGYWYNRLKRNFKLIFSRVKIWTNSKAFYWVQ